MYFSWFVDSMGAFIYTLFRVMLSDDDMYFLSTGEGDLQVPSLLFQINNENKLSSSEQLRNIFIKNKCKSLNRWYN